MRFKRLDRYEFTDTPRKRAALHRKQRLEREALPLFADQIASEQASPDDIMAARAERAVRDEVERRQRRAADWRRARRGLNAYSGAERSALLAYWQRCQWPGDPMYLLSMLHMHANDRLDATKAFRSTTAAAAEASA